MNATEQSVERDRAITPILKPSSNAPAALTPAFWLEAILEEILYSNGPLPHRNHCGSAISNTDA